MERRIWHSVDAEELHALLGTGEAGLSREEAARRLEENGPNRLDEGEKRSMLSIFIGQFKDFMIWVLLAAALISGFLGEWVDTGIILVVVVINAVMGTVQESRAEAALEALKEMAAPFAKVLRGGESLRVPAGELVVGDVVSAGGGGQHSCGPAPCRQQLPQGGGERPDGRIGAGGEERARHYG
jgi:Ca2+-transporting ATPase